MPCDDGSADVHRDIVSSWRMTMLWCLFVAVLSVSTVVAGVVIVVADVVVVLFYRK